MKDKKRNEPFINIWFGNFYEPAFSNGNFIEKAIAEIKDLGFNNVMLDSKSWQDFFDRYKGNPPSQYVKMQEFMMQTIESFGLSHNFLAIYLNGDNLYPHIRFSPPVLGEAIVDYNGNEKRWYKYWSEKAQSVMIEHVKGLFNLYSNNYSTIEVQGQEKYPLCSMWDPIVEASFDEEGIKRYINWLKDTYKNDIEALNKAYGTSFSNFNELKPDDYWYTIKYKEYSLTKEDVLKRSYKFIVWADNMKWKRDEFRKYFQSMQEKFKKLNSSLYLIPNISQWNVFFNVDGSKLTGVSFSDLWDTVNRGIDPYEIEKYVDCCTFTTVPVNPYGDADAYVVSAQSSMIRAMNRNRDFIVGTFFGRFLYNDIYKFITPAEIIGTIVASGAKGYFAYGYCGLDDGGVLHKMDSKFKNSIKAGNGWAKEVISVLGKRKNSIIAILYPSAMALLEPITIEGNLERRMDMLGYYKAICDSGYSVDIIHQGQIDEGILSRYKILIIPANNCYEIDRNEKAEIEIKQWLKSGGIIIHGPNDYIANNLLGIKEENHIPDCIHYYENVLLRSIEFSTYTGEKVIASYLKDDKGCIVLNRFGKGKIYSLGFNYGYSYVSKILPHVPQEQGNREFYPIPFLNKDPFKDILKENNQQDSNIADIDIEFSYFENGMVIVNHSSYPYDTSKFEGEKIFQFSTNSYELLPHSAVFIKKKD